MRLSTQLVLASASLAAAAADTTVPRECLGIGFTSSPSELLLNATNIDAIVNCTLYTYQCPPEKPPSAGDKKYTLAYYTTPPPAAANCTKGNFSVYFQDETMTGALVVPRLVTTETLSLNGYIYSPPEGEEEPIDLSLQVQSIEFPDLVNVTEWGLSIHHANNLSSISFPKLEYARSLSFNLSGGPVVNLSFPNLRATDASGISISGNIDALEFPRLNDSNKINIASTGNLDCVAFAASVVNATGTWWLRPDEVPMVCSSKRGRVETHKEPKETSGGCGRGKGVWGVEMMMMLVLGVGWVGLVV